MELWKILLHNYVKTPEDIDIITLDSVLKRLASICYEESIVKGLDESIEEQLMELAYDKDASKDLFRIDIYNMLSHIQKIEEEKKQFEELFLSIKSKKKEE